MGREAVRHEGAGAFLARAEAWLLEGEDRNNLILSLAYSRLTRGASEPDSFFATLERDGRVVGCALRTPPHKLLLTEMPVEVVPVLLRAVADAYDSIPAVLGTRPLAESLASAWVEAKGGRWRPGMEQRLYRLDEVSHPEPVGGRPRAARSDDVGLITEWGAGFAHDTGAHDLVSAKTSARWIGEGKLFLWEEGGRAVSMTAARGRTPRGVRIGYVYTPPEQRGRGYASALVASVSQRMLDDGAGFCVLFTNLSDPTSNAMYQRLGYRPVVDLVDVDLSGADST